MGREEPFHFFRFSKQKQLQEKKTIHSEGSCVCLRVSPCGLSPGLITKDAESGQVREPWGLFFHLSET